MLLGAHEGHILSIGDCRGKEKPYHTWIHWEVLKALIKEDFFLKKTMLYMC